MLPIKYFRLYLIGLNASHDLTEYAPAKTGEYASDIRQFSELCMFGKLFEG